MPFGKRCSGKIKSVRDEKKSWLLENTYFQVPMYYFHPSPINSSFIHFSLKKILVKVNLNLRFYCSHPDTCRPLINLKRERINRSSAQEKKKIIYTRTLTPKLKSTSKKKKKKVLQCLNLSIALTKSRWNSRCRSPAFQSLTITRCAGSIWQNENHWSECI